MKFSSGEAGSYYYQLDGTVPTAASLVAAGTNQTTMAAAENTITINSLAAGSHTLYVAAADAAGNVSGLLTFTIPAWTPGGDNTAPALTTGSAVRISDIQATVSFTANEAGSYHYLVQEVAATAPTTAQVQGSANAGTMQAGANSFAPPPLADDAAKAVYIVAEDAAGNLSNMLTVIIPPDHTATQTPGSLGKGENALFTFKGEYVYLAGVSLTHQNGTVYSFGMAQTGGKTVLTHGTATAGDVVPGSVKVTLYAAWLDTLPAGSYTLSVAFNDGVVQSRGDAGFTLTREQQGATIQEPTTPTSGSPQTGDSSNLGLWVALLAASIAVLGGGVWLLARRRRRTQR
ncbi:MAG: LPXTG cell wall anchor domain-containing protein [Porticoccaceae bacterium]